MIWLLGLIVVARLADERDGVTLAGDVEGRVLRRRDAGAIDRNVGAAPRGQLQHGGDSAVAPVHRVRRSKLRRQHTPLLEQIDRDHLGAERLGDQHAREFHRPETEHRDRVSAGDAEALLDVVLRAHHVGEQRARLIRQRLPPAAAGNWPPARRDSPRHGRRWRCR
jgi:hypothetical protein